MEFSKLSDREEEIGKAVIEAALRIHKELGLRLGYLINFNVPLIKQGIKRMIL